ncbi:hypothetical protein IFO70_31960 [Phormidium tenue FACHB-886]|nr:hypothetical protein [Phormidium tenue FACHB-886]
MFANSFSASDFGFLKKIGSFQSEKGSEISAFDSLSDRLFVAGSTVEILDSSNLANPNLMSTLTSGFAIPASMEVISNSVTLKNGAVAVAYASRDITT